MGDLAHFGGVQTVGQCINGDNTPRAVPQVLSGEKGLHVLAEEVGLVGKAVLLQFSSEQQSGPRNQDFAQKLLVVPYRGDHALRILDDGVDDMEVVFASFFGDRLYDSDKCRGFVEG